MATYLDPFSAQIVELVRSMPDEAILELVRAQLGGGGGASPLRAVARAVRRGVRRAAAPSRKPGKVGRPRKRGPRATSADRVKLLDTVERAVKSSRGLSASEIAKKVGLPQSRVAAAVRELKGAKRIFQGGDRRFARYAGDAKTAQTASLNSRKNAAGPRRGKGKKK